MTTQSEFTVTHPWHSDQRTPLRWIGSHIGRNPWIIVGSFMGAAGNAGLAAVVPLFSGYAFDAILQNTPNLRALLYYCIAIVVSQLVRALLQLMRNFGAEVLGQRLERDTRQELYAGLLGKNMDFHDAYATGEIMARATNDVRELALMMAPGLNLVIGSANFLIIPLIVAPAYHPSLILTPLLFAVGYAITMRDYLRDLEPVTAAVRQRFGKLNAGLTAAIEGIETVKGGTQEEREVDHFAQNARGVREALVAQGRVEARFLPVLLLGIAQAIGLGHALWLYQRGLLSVGDVVGYTQLIALLGFPVFVSLFSYSQAASGLSSARRILELMRAPTRLDQNSSGYQGQMAGAIHFDGVTFTYHQGEQANAHPALSQITFEVAAGQTLAVVGQTGAGKSTLGKLLNRTYDIDQGRILIDGVDIRDWQLAALRGQISIIEQDIFLFSRAIADNIAFGKPGATQAEIEQAGRMAQAHDFIMSFPDGYQTIVGERGTMLSGGQRQRIALARAFLTNPAILILDDSTSAIDSATEDQIQKAIETTAHGRTTILITHRLSQIRWADKIVLLRQGEVAAVGTHEELLEQSQAYRNIFAQF
ncbi:MAG: ABC transporter ATP-binding protein [Caldilineaceae bacterium]|nr:ABC transporter ATP-binding protein [Caldilineaceae bacterium]